jgi:membrane protease YdiL (CAAX protease family)
VKRAIFVPTAPEKLLVEPMNELKPNAVSWKAITGVAAIYLIARFSFHQILCANILQFPSTSLSSFLKIAIITALFTITELTAVIPIYFSLRPASAFKWADTFALHIRTTHYSPVRIILYGFLTFLITLPIIVAANCLESRLGLKTAINPIMTVLTWALQVKDNPGIAILCLSVGVVAPITEEALVRGFLYGALRQRMNFLFATAITAFFFALSHFESISLELFFLGVIYAWSIERTKSVLPAMIAHALWNCSIMGVRMFN